MEAHLMQLSEETTDCLGWLTVRAFLAQPAYSVFDELWLNGSRLIPGLRDGERLIGLEQNGWEFYLSTRVTEYIFEYLEHVIPGSYTAVEQYYLQKADESQPPCQLDYDLQFSFRKCSNLELVRQLVSECPSGFWELVAHMPARTVHYLIFPSDEEEYLLNPLEIFDTFEPLQFKVENTLARVVANEPGFGLRDCFEFSVGCFGIPVADYPTLYIVSKAVMATTGLTDLRVEQGIHWLTDPLTLCLHMLFYPPAGEHEQFAIELKWTEY